MLSYYEKKEGQQSSRLFIPKDSDSGASITYSEVIFWSDDNFLYVLGKLQEHTSGVSKDYKPYQIPENELVLVRLLKVKEHSSTYKGETKVQKQTSLELYLVTELSLLDHSKAYKGTIRFHYDHMISYLLGLQPTQLPEAILEVERKNCINLTEIARTLQQEETKKAYSASFSKSQTELDKLNDRFTFFLTKLQETFPSAKLNNVGDVMSLLADDADTNGYVHQVCRMISLISSLNFVDPPF